MPRKKAEPKEKPSQKKTRAAKAQARAPRARRVPDGAAVERQAQAKTRKTLAEKRAQRRELAKEKRADATRARGLCASERDGVKQRYDARIEALDAQIVKLAGQLPPPKPSRATERAGEERDALTSELEAAAPQLLPWWRKRAKRLQTLWRKYTKAGNRISFLEYVLERADASPGSVVAAQSQDARSWFNRELAAQEAQAAVPGAAPPAAFGQPWAMPQGFASPAAVVPLSPMRSASTAASIAGSFRSGAAVNAAGFRGFAAPPSRPFVANTAALTVLEEAIRSRPDLDAVASKAPTFRVREGDRAYRRMVQLAQENNVAGWTGQSWDTTPPTRLRASPTLVSPLAPTPASSRSAIDLARQVRSQAVPPSAVPSSAAPRSVNTSAGIGPAFGSVYTPPPPAPGSVRPSSRGDAYVSQSFAPSPSAFSFGPPSSPAVSSFVPSTNTPRGR